MFYWVIHRVSNNLIPHGPWRTEDSRDKAFERSKGGEIHKFNNFTEDPEKTIEEFRAEEIKRL